MAARDVIIAFDQHLLEVLVAEGFAKVRKGWYRRPLGDRYTLLVWKSHAVERRPPAVAFTASVGIVDPVSVRIGEAAGLASYPVQLSDNMGYIGPHKSYMQFRVPLDGDGAGAADDVVGYLHDWIFPWAEEHATYDTIIDELEKRAERTPLGVSAPIVAFAHDDLARMERAIERGERAIAEGTIRPEYVAQSGPAFEQVAAYLRGRVTT